MPSYEKKDNGRVQEIDFEDALNAMIESDDESSMIFAVLQANLEASSKLLPKGSQVMVSVRTPNRLKQADEKFDWVTAASNIEVTDLAQELGRIREHLFSMMPEEGNG